MNQDQNNAAAYRGQCILRKLVSLALLTEKEAAKILKIHAEYHQSSLFCA
jgi:hypothetical protein